MKNENSKTESRYFYAAMYLRLSREDSDVGTTAGSGSTGSAEATFRAESNSIGSQRELIRSFIREQEDMELFDCYADDNYSGSNFERPEFKRMLSDIRAGRVNCVIVKDLSRFGRDYIETGRYLDQVFPTLGVRFIALTDRYDSFSADAGERNIVLPVKNFINDSYCRDISTKVKSQLAVKRRKGECLAAFAVYGYRKSAEDRNRLLVDGYAADIVRRIFVWKIEGMAVSAIAEKLNSLHILSPKEYKKSQGLNYRGGFTRSSGSKWSSPSVRRILTNEVYLGHLVQGKTERINYKVKKCVEKPEEEWVRVENAHEPIISADDFAIVQNLLKADGRVSPEKKEISPFMGLLFCRDCKEQMVRRVNRYKGTEKIYYICSTKNRGEGCSRHSIEETVLKELAGTAIRRYANDFLEQEQLFAQAREREANLQAVINYNKEISRLKKEQDKYYSLCAGLYEDLRTGVITKEEFERLHGEFQKKAENLSAAEEKQEQLVREMFKSGVLSAGRLASFKDSLELKEVDRHTLASLVKRIWVYEGKKIEIEFYFTDQYQTMKDFHREDGSNPVTYGQAENQKEAALPGTERGHDMGRTSKRTHAAASAKAMAPGTGQGKKQGGKYYKAGIYARLSSDQDLKKNESVETQIEIAKRYVEDWNQHHGDKIEIVGQYADLGKTGTNFDRDDFKRLMQDVRLGDINCVIVKDLSRFGRNYLEAGNYIEKIFPFLGVRFIAVADGYDTGMDGSNTKQMASEIKNLVNDMYAKDFSAKAKLSLQQRREAGSYVGGPSPYGYEACMEGRLRKLKPDGNTVEIVRFIYKKFLETESYQAVADELNDRRINPPAIYKKSKETYCPVETAYKGWDKGAVERILKSATYTGGLVQGRTSITARKEENRVRRPEEEWVKKENTHEAIISQELYGQVQEIHRRIQERTRSHSHPTKGCPIGENIFDKVLYCGVCGRKMTRHSYVKDYADGRRERKGSYFCLDSIGSKSENCPESNRISKTELANILSFLFRAEFATQLKRQKDYVEQGQALVHQKKQKLEQQLHQTERAMAALSEEEGEKYMAYRLGSLPQEEYVRYRLWKEERLRELEKQKSRCQEEEKKLKRKGEAYLKAVRSLVKLKSGVALTKELVEALIERIYVYPGKRVEIVFTYGDIRREGVE